MIVLVAFGLGLGLGWYKYNNKQTNTAFAPKIRYTNVRCAELASDEKINTVNQWQVIDRCMGKEAYEQQTN